MNREFTATAYILHENRVLLHLHEKLNKWLPPGGHIEPNETPPEAVKREVKEETGLDIRFIEEEHLKIDDYNARSIERPFLCLIENIPAYKENEPHQHIDFIYLAKPVELKDPMNGFKWFTYEQLEEIDPLLFPDTRKILHLLLKKKLNSPLPTTAMSF